MFARIASLLRWEDVVLSLAVLVVPLAGTLSGVDREAAVEPDWVAGILGLVAVAGVVACLLTRGPGETPPLEDGTLTLQGWARFPLAAGVGLVAAETLPGIGLDGGPFVALVFLAALGSGLAFGRLPVVPADVRRALVAPMTLLAAGAFDRVMGSGFDQVLGDVVGGGVPAELAFLVPLVVGAVGALYVMLVVAPRAIADPGASWLAWAVRFAILLVSIAAGQVLIGVL